MNNNNEEMVERAAVKSQKQGLDALEKLYEVTRPKAVYGEPVTVGERTVITASEVRVGLGFGFGMGTGPQAGMAAAQPGGDGHQEETTGGGGGGGGASAARPVAIINVGPEGVRIEPVLDVSKLGLAAIGAMGGVLMMWGKMRRHR